MLADVYCSGLAPMPTFDEAKQVFKDTYVKQGFRLVDEHQRELFFAVGETNTIRFTVPAEEIEEYRSVANELPAIHVGPVDTSIIGPNFCEQLIETSSPGRVPVLIYRNGRHLRFEAPEGDGTVVLIGSPSSAFFNFFRFRKEQAAFLRDRLDRHGYVNRGTLRDVFSRFLTIRIETSELIEHRDLDKITLMFESCLFELSYTRGAHLQLQSEWPSFGIRRRSLFLGRRRFAGSLPLKRIRYSLPALRFYQRGVATNDAYIQFLSFYHVLEFNFVSVSDRILYAKLSRIYMDPIFRPVPLELDKVILAVEEHKRTNDETEMLRNVLLSYVDEKETIAFIEEYEQTEKTKIYTEKSECFGEELEKLTLRENHVFGLIAKRVKTIRNTLVHSSDRYERKERYLPGPDADRALYREIPLIRFLAERVIIATAQPLD
jgi:hypothetical protein